MTSRTVGKASASVRNQIRLLLGLGLVLTGLFVMVGNTTGTVRLLGLVFLLGLGLMLILWGVIAQTSGPIIPGALITGVSTGALLTQEVYGLRSVESAGIHALAIAGGFFLITLLTLLFAGPTLWWPLIPGSLLLLGGINLLLDNVVLLNMSDFWPLAMIVGGTYLLVRFLRSQ
ncbi:MAG TPA: hypothetical protein VKY59_12290 [Spirillospora sp.]|nr:hypothetical protein [Spirillospora sp.]